MNDGGKDAERDGDHPAGLIGPDSIEDIAPDPDAEERPKLVAKKQETEHPTAKTNTQMLRYSRSATRAGRN